MTDEDVCLGGRFGEGMCGSIVLSCFVCWCRRTVSLEASFFTTIHSQKFL